MTKILVDTSIIIDFLRRKDKENAPLFKLSSKEHDLYASIVTYAESYAGKSVWERENVEKNLEKVFSGIEIFTLEREIAKNAGKIRATYGTDIIDAIIAATALFHKLDLATLNIKDFKKITGIKLKEEF